MPIFGKFGKTGVEWISCLLCIFWYLLTTWRISRFRSGIDLSPPYFHREKQTSFCVSIPLPSSVFFRMKGKAGIFQVLLNGTDECFLSNLTLKKTTHGLSLPSPAMSVVSALQGTYTNRTTRGQLKLNVFNFRIQRLMLSCVYLLSGTFIWCFSIALERKAMKPRSRLCIGSCMSLPTIFRCSWSMQYIFPVNPAELNTELKSSKLYSYCFAFFKKRKRSVPCLQRVDILMFCTLCSRNGA